MDSLNCFKERVEISKPSMRILPSKASNILSIVSVIVDLPAPVLPTTPIFSLGLIVTFKAFNAGGNPSLYCTE